MKHYTMSQFKKDGFSIPNLPAHFKIEIQDPIHSWYGRMANFYVDKEWFNNLQEEVHLDWSEENRWCEFLSIYCDEMRYSDSDSYIAYVMGLTTRRAYESGRSILDALYYQSNPPKFRFKNGKLKDGFWTALSERIRGRGQFSTTTLEMFNYGWEEFKKEVPQHTDEDKTILFARKLNAEVFFCPLTSKPYPSSLIKRIKIGNKWERVLFSLTPEDVGMVMVSSGDPSWWKQPDQILYRDRIYNPNELELTECPDCHNQAVVGDMIDGICHPCYDNKYKIHNYSTRVPGLLSFKATKVRPTAKPVEPQYFGIEIEYETTNKDKAKKKVIDLLHGHAILKSDGSIRDGFEIVTCPATADIHLEVFKNFYDNKPVELQTADNVGMHIHISRKPLNLFTIGKMTEFLNRISNKDFVKYVAGRAPNHYCQMMDRTLTYPLVGGRGDRYNALNLNPPETIEMRIFSTPSNYEEFASRLQFAQALVEYCGPAQHICSLKDLTKYQTFLSWVGKHRKTYPELVNHLKGIN